MAASRYETFLNQIETPGSELLALETTSGMVMSLKERYQGMVRVVLSARGLIRRGQGNELQSPKWQERLELELNEETLNMIAEEIAEPELTYIPRTPAASFLDGLPAPDNSNWFDRKRKPISYVVDVDADGTDTAKPTQYEAADEDPESDEILPTGNRLTEKTFQKHRILKVY